MNEVLMATLEKVLADYQPPKGGVPATLVGYARVSTSDQRLDLQLDALKRFGVLDENVHVEKVSAVANRRPVLKKALDQCRRGDILIVWKFDRLARSLMDLLRIMETLQERGVGFRSLTENVDTTTPSGRLIVQVMGSIAEFERQLIADRARAGMYAARDRGKHIGAPLKIDLTAAATLLKKGVRVAEVADTLGVSVTTVYKHFPPMVLEKWRKPVKK